MKTTKLKRRDLSDPTSETEPLMEMTIECPVCFRVWIFEPTIQQLRSVDPAIIVNKDGEGNIESVVVHANDIECPRPQCKNTGTFTVAFDVIGGTYIIYEGAIDPDLGWEDI